MRKLLYGIGLLGLVVLILMPGIRANAQSDPSGEGPNELITGPAPPKAGGEGTGAAAFPEEPVAGVGEPKRPVAGVGEPKGPPRQFNITKIPEEVDSGSQDQSDDQQQSQSDDQQQAQNDSAQADEQAQADKQAQAEENKASEQSPEDDNSTKKGYGCSARP